MSSQRELALYLNNLQGHTTQQKIEAILEMEADCNLDEVCLMKVIENIAESERSTAVAIRAHTTLIRKNTTLIRKKQKWSNKGTDKQYVAEFFIDSTTCHI